MTPFALDSLTARRDTARIRLSAINHSSSGRCAVCRIRARARLLSNLGFGQSERERKRLADKQGGLALTEESKRASKHKRSPDASMRYRRSRHIGPCVHSSAHRHWSVTGKSGRTRARCDWRCASAPAEEAARGSLVRDPRVPRIAATLRRPRTVHPVVSLRSFRPIVFIPIIAVAQRLRDRRERSARARRSSAVEIRRLGSRGQCSWMITR